MQRGKQVVAPRNPPPAARHHERLEAGIRILTSFAIGSLRGAKANLERAGKAHTREK